MTLPTLPELVALIDVLQARGVTSFETPELKLTLRSLVPVRPEASNPAPVDKPKPRTLDDRLFKRRGA